MLRGDSSGGEVLDPDAGVKQFGLVPSDHKRAGVLAGGGGRDFRAGETMLLEIPVGKSKHFAAHLIAEAQGGSTLEIVIPGCQACEVIGQDGRQTIGGRVHQQAAVDRGSPQLPRAHPIHPAGASSPARLSAFSNTRR